MKILLLGVGMQGKATLHDLVHSQGVENIIAADGDFEALVSHVEEQQYGDRVVCEAVDATDPASIGRLMASEPDVVIDLLPVTCHDAVARIAVERGRHLVNASYVTPGLPGLADQARAKGITLLPEFGMDPGIDLVLLGEAVRSLDSVEEIITYGAGFPEPAATDNPLKYKVTWTFEGVLKSYLRAGRVIREGQVIEIKSTEMFRPEHLHELKLEGLGRLEAFPNGDALKYADLLGLDASGLRNLGRYVLRWPGHSNLWQTLVDLHLLDDEPVMVDGVAVDRKRFLAAVIEPHIRYKAEERDVVVVRIDLKGRKDGKRTRVVHQVIDRRDLETGHTAMSRTVGYTASIGAQMIASGQISKQGLLSPVNDVPYDLLVRELQERGIQVTSWRDT
ncbi:MAG: saccharopine dehydrogenase C-terminal domain-containing protein [Anaerolineae bacterium]|jgi:saccharopine dehydrogenase-like NADP-dependent oxidoreductase